MAELEKFAQEADKRLSEITADAVLTRRIQTTLSAQAVLPRQRRIMADVAVPATAVLIVLLLVLSSPVPGSVAQDGTSQRVWQAMFSRPSASAPSEIDYTDNAIAAVVSPSPFAVAMATATPFRTAQAVATAVITASPEPETTQTVAVDHTLATNSSSGSTPVLVSPAVSHSPTPAITVAPSPVSYSLVQITENGLIGFMSATGNVVVEPEFHTAGPFNEGVAIVGTNGPDGTVYGVITQQGYVSDLIFSRIGEFNEGVAPAQYIGDGGWGYINMYGQWIVAPAYERAERFEGGMGTLVKDGKETYVNRGGVVTDAPFRPITPGPEVTPEPNVPKGARVVAREGRYTVYEQSVEGELLQGVADASGAVVLPPMGKSVSVTANGFIISAQTDEGLRYGFADISGAVTIRPRFYNITECPGETGLLIAQPASAPQVGLMDSTGMWVTLPIYDRITWSNGYLISVTLSADGVSLTGFQDFDGNWVRTGE